MSEKPHFLARKIQDYQRLSARGFVCPICDQYFQHEPKLWEHAQATHLQAPKSSTSNEGDDIRKQFRNEAMEKAHQKRRRNRDIDARKVQQSSNDNDSMRPNVGDESGSPVPLRPLSAPGPTTNTGKEINDMKDLQLSQDQGSKLAHDGQPVVQSPIIPLKRGAVTESDSPGTFPEAGHRIASNRRAKASSGGPFTLKDKDPDFYREASHPVEIDTSRNPPGSAKRLFNPNIDNASSFPGVRSSKPDATFTPRRLYDSRTHVFRSRKAPAGERGDVQHKIMLNSSFNNVTQLKKTDKSPGQPIKVENNQDNQAAPDDKIDTDPSYIDTDAETEPDLILQPETRPISHEQLVVEVKGIYAGLVMVEAKCIDVDEKQSMEAQEKNPSRQTKLSNEQWQALITLHKTLLHEHHDFFLASQHPSASPALSRLAAKYSMPARMWRHGIHAFLEVLRHRLPESLDFMLAFIYIAYSMMALLYETVSMFEDTWVECLGDLGRYRMAIEDEDPRDREVWSGVARFWYSKAADKSPNLGRLYHHLAILARPYTLQQLSFYARSLTCVTPFESAKASIMTLFTPILNGKESAYHRSTSFETVFIKAHGILFCGRSSAEFKVCLNQIENNLLDNYIGRITAKFKEQGVFIAIACIAALFEYGPLRESGASKSIFRLAFEEVRAIQLQKLKTASQRLQDEAFDMNDSTSNFPPAPTMETLTPSEIRSSLLVISPASALAFGSLSIALSRTGDKNVYPLVHVYFVFLWGLAAAKTAMSYVEQDVPWAKICLFLNTLSKLNTLTFRAQREDFPQPEEGVGRPLPEDFIIRGQMYSQSYFPETWFKDAMMDDEERVLELPSIAAPRGERILWLGFRLVSFNRWISFDHDSQTFSVTSYAVELSETSRLRRESSPSTLQTSNDEDTIMVDINAAEDSSDKASKTPETRSDTLTSSPIKENKPSNRDYKIDVDAENDFHKSPPKTPTSPVIGTVFRLSPDMNLKEIPTYDYFSDTRKFESLNKFDNSAVKKSPKA